MTKDCRKCIYGFPFFDGLPVEDDDVMQCRWKPSSPLPYSWRWVQSEVVAVHPQDAEECEAYEPEVD